MSDIDRKRMATCSDRQQCELLLIVRCEHELSKPINLGPAGKAWMHPVKSWLAVGGDCEPLPEYEWYILWPQPWGLQTAWWPYNPPMGKAYGS